MAVEPMSERDEGRWDPLIERLRELRLRAGDPSYAEIAARITEGRRRQGTDEHAAKIARSTVYDAFRLGRTRLNAPLVREIVEVLGSDPGTVDAWLADVARAPRSPSIETLSDGQVPTRPAALPEAPPPASSEAPPTVTPEPPSKPSAETAAAEPLKPPEPTARLALGLMAAFLAINLIGRLSVDILSFPFYLDMIGTAAAAVILGPWRGVAVGALTSILAVAISGPGSLAFLHAEVAGALIWGYGARSLIFNRSVQRYFSLNVIVGLVVSALAIPVLYLFFPEGTRSGASDTILNMQEVFGSRIAATILGNVVTNQLDKLVSGFAALTLLAAMPLAIRSRSPLARLLATPE